MRPAENISRRAAIAGTALVGAAAAASSACSAEETPASSGALPAVPRQPGIVTAPPASARLTALDVTVRDRSALATVLRALSDRAGQANGGGRASVTVAFGASLFDDRYGLAALRPRRLTEMTAFPNDVLDPAQCHGDLLLQVCAPEAATVAQISDQLTAAVGGAVRIRWRIDGFRAENQVTPAGKFVDRNPFGFRDGAGNPDAGDAALMDRLVWVGAGAESGEPAWTAGGTYQVVRLIRLATALWNTDPVERQEAVFGRRKATGAPLGGAREDDAPAYADDPDGNVTPLDAHIRRANPRTPETEGSQILRRGYGYRRAADPAGNPDEGLVFICFQADLERGFITVQRRLAGEALDKYVLPYGGGYFFAPPAHPTLFPFP